MPENKRPGGPRRTAADKPRSNAGDPQSPRSRSNQPTRRGPNQASPTNRRSTRSNSKPDQAAPAPQRNVSEEESREEDIITTGPEQPEYVTIAQISAPFGLRGAVKASIRTDFPDRFDTLDEVYIAPPGGTNIVNWERKELLSAKLQNDKVVVLRFKDLTKVEQVEGLRGYNVAVPFAETVPLPEGEYYIFQIIGLDVYTTAEVFVGKVVNVERLPASDVYTVRGPLSKNDVLIPAIKDVVKEIDLDSGRMTIELLEGLI